MTDTVRLDCPAKLNLTLDVGPPDPAAGGRHPVISWMVALAFADTLTVARRAPAGGGDAGTAFQLAFAPDAPAPQPIDWPIASDLAFRAHAAVRRHVGRPLPVAVQLDKRIPTGAGLGGGSADAAGMLVALRRLFALKLDDDALFALAAPLGADVSFALLALLGRPAALAGGYGERLEPLPTPNPPLHLALVLPPFACPTGTVYAAFDAAGSAEPPNPALARERVSAPGPPTRAAYFNDLTDAACAVRPGLRALLEALHAARFPAHVTGSGSAVFVPAADARDARRLAAELAALCGFPVIATRTL